MKKMLLLLLLFFGWGREVRAQEEEGLRTTALHRVTMNRNDTVVQFYAVPADANVRIDRSASYFWYVRDTIMVTVGGYSGHVLDGIYNRFYPNKSLLESGQFTGGLKTGEWRTWDPDGNLRSISRWKNGRLITQEDVSHAKKVNHADSLSGKPK